MFRFTVQYSILTHMCRAEDQIAHKEANPSTIQQVAPCGYCQPCAVYMLYISMVEGKLTDHTGYYNAQGTLAAYPS